MNQSNPDLELPEMPLPPELPPDEDATPPLGLPTTVDYHHLITLLTALLPGVDPTLVCAVRIDYRDVTVEYWTGHGIGRHTMPITHVQGSATEGGAPTTPPTGLTNIDGSDTQ